MCRGDRREAIFADDKDWECFIETLAQAGKRAGWRIGAVLHCSVFLATEPLSRPHRGQLQLVAL